MKVFVFDLLPYGEHLDHLKNGKELPWPLPRRHFKPEVAVRTYAEHLSAWEAMDRLGYDGVGFNEHHTSPYGLMNSPNLLAAAAAQRTQRLKLLMYGNLLPLHDPLRLAEELAMLDCMSNGRIVSGFARGIPREHNVYGVPLADSRARFEEAWEIIYRAWTEEVFLSSSSFDYLRPENLPAMSGARERYRDMTMADVEREAEHMPWGPADEVIERLISAADHAGAGTVLVNMNRGAMPHEMFMEQVHRFGGKVLPVLQAHTVRAR